MQDIEARRMLAAHLDKVNAALVAMLRDWHSADVVSDDVLASDEYPFDTALEDMIAHVQACVDRIEERNEEAEERSHFDVEVRILSGTLTPGDYVVGASTMREGGEIVSTSTWAGTFDGIRESDGELYVYFTGGHINGTGQGHHGFPLSQLR